MRMMMLVVLTLVLAAVLVAGGTPAEGVSRYPNRKAQVAWEQMGKRWEAAAQSVYGTLGDVTKIRNNE